MAIAFLIAFGSSVCMVTGYAAYLAFQAMGAPDQTMIYAFAASNAEGVVSLLFGAGTLVGGLLAGRKADEDPLQNGLAVGLITALANLVMGFFSSMNLWTAVSFALCLIGGWLGRQLASRRVRAQRF